MSNMCTKMDSWSPSLLHLPSEICLPVFIDAMADDNATVHDTIDRIANIFGIHYASQNMDTIILYMLEKNHLAGLAWILKNQKRRDRYMPAFVRHLRGRLDKSRNSQILIEVFDMLCRLGHTQQLFEFVWDTRLVSRYLSSSADFRTKLCILGAKYGHIDVLDTFLTDRDVNKNDENTIDKERCRIAFYMALSKGMARVYEYLHARHLHNDVPEMEYAYAEVCAVKNGLTAPLHFLLKKDPRTWHVSQTCKRIIFRPDSVKTFRLRDPLNASACVSTRCYANYNPEYDACISRE